MIWRRARHVAVFLLCLTGAVGGAWPEICPAETSRLDRWAAGLEHLDAGHPLEAAAYFTEQIVTHPQHLEMWEAWLQAAGANVHADSVGVMAWRLQRQYSHPWAHRYLTAVDLQWQSRFVAATDSLDSLALDCEQAGDLVSAWMVRQRQADCRIDGYLTAGFDLSARELIRAALWLEAHPRALAQNDLTLAHLQFKSDQLDSAENQYRDLLTRARRHGFAVVVCDIYNALGGVTSKQRRVEESVAYYRDMVAQARLLHDPRRLLLGLTNLGYQYTSLRALEKAEACLTEARQLVESQGQKRMRGSVEAGLGALEEMAGHRQEAVDHFTRAIAQNQQGGNPMIALGARQRLAYNLSLMGRYGEARAHYHTCLDSLEGGGTSFILNWVYGGLAYANQRLGYLDEAVEYFRLAHAVNLEMGDRMSAAWCLDSLGQIEASRGNYRQAISLSHEAMEAYRQLGDGEGEGDVRAGLAEFYLRLGNVNESLEQAAMAQKLAEGAGAEELLRRAAHVTARAYDQAGQQDKAEANYLRVLAVARQWSDRLSEVRVLNDLADYCLRTGRPEEAREHLDLALNLMAGEEYYPVRARTCLLVARATTDPNEAAEWAGSALQLARSGGFPEREWQALADLGLYQRRLGEVGLAEESLREAIDRVESLRRGAGADELRLFMLEPALVPYERLLDLYAEELGDARAAFGVSERSRAQLLASRLQAARIEQGPPEESPADPHERDLRAQLTFLQSRLQDLDLSRVVRDSLRSRVNRVEEELALVQLRRVRGDEEGVLAAPAVDQLLEVLTPDEHLLSYFVGEEKMYLFSVTRRQVRVHPLGDSAALDNKIKRYLQLQRRAQANDGLPDAVMIQARGELYRLLIAPAAGDIAEDAELIMAPDGLMHRLPFAYLHDGQGYLVEHFTLFVTPSLRVLSELRSRPVRRGEGGKVLAIAGEVGDTTRTHPYDEDQGFEITDLPEAEGEVWQLARRFPAAEVLVGTAATEQSLRGGTLQEADIIHVAAHGYTDPVDFRKSYIMLSRQTGVAGADDDGLLQWQEIMNLEINPSLVTLASCRSAQGVFSRGEGVTGLTQAFLHAGSRGVLASLTDVPDRGTRWIMDRFYSELAEGKTAAQSLQTAQLAGLEWAREQGREAVLPGAAFVLIGDGDLRYAGAQRPWNRWLVVMGLLVVLGSVWMAAGAPRKLWHFPKKQV